MINRLVLIVLAIAIAATACGGSDDTVAPPEATPAAEVISEPASEDTPEPTETPAVEASPTPAPTTTPEPTTAPVAEPTPAPNGDDPVTSADVAARVRAYFDAREAANSGPEPDPRDPRLEAVASGEALRAVRGETRRRAEAGQAIRPGEQGLAEIRVAVAQGGPESATVSVCSIDDGVIYVVESGEVINDSVVTHNYLIDLVLGDGVWTVNRITRLQQWEGVAGCALAPDDFPF